jgi:hypothetical protein
MHPLQIASEVVNYLLLVERNFFRQSTNDIKGVAFQLAVANHLPHSFTMESGKAGKKWLWNFLQMHVTLSLKISQATSAAQMKRFTPINIAPFFDIL